MMAADWREKFGPSWNPSDHYGGVGDDGQAEPPPARMAPMAYAKGTTALELTLHNPPAHPHWSEAVEWRHDRWDPMVNAPRAGWPILDVRGRTAEGRVIEPIHYACGDGDGMMPPYDGWFAPDTGGRGFHEVSPVEWQPLRATFEPKT